MHERPLTSNATIFVFVYSQQFLITAKVSNRSIDDVLLFDMLLEFALYGTHYIRCICGSKVSVDF